VRPAWLCVFILFADSTVQDSLVLLKKSYSSLLKISCGKLTDNSVAEWNFKLWPEIVKNNLNLGTAGRPQAQQRKTAGSKLPWLGPFCSVLVLYSILRRPLRVIRWYNLCQMICCRDFVIVHSINCLPKCHGPGRMALSCVHSAWLEDSLPPQQNTFPMNLCLRHQASA
jgi:hypothetical protein